ncbi:MAG: hypothetical protein ACN6PR_07435 [Achromobacter sp.]
MSMNDFASGRAAFVGCVAWALAAGFGAMPATAAQASPPQSEATQEWPEVETVRTLLRADAAAALADCRIPGICPAGEAMAAPGEPQVRPRDDIRVAAIFGLSRRLSADVVVNGALLRYQAGRAAPVAGEVSAGAYQLLAIEGACVRLRRDAADHTACLAAGRVAP